MKFFRTIHSNSAVAEAKPSAFGEIKGSLGAEKIEARETILRAIAAKVAGEDVEDAHELSAALDLFGMPLAILDTHLSAAQSAAGAAEFRKTYDRRMAANDAAEAKANADIIKFRDLLRDATGRARTAANVRDTLIGTSREFADLEHFNQFLFSPDASKALEFAAKPGLTRDEIARIRGSAYRESEADNLRQRKLARLEE
jgi:hypothetical protein